jgi:DNA/RNA endonuclease YhcR with UshA esterase domain
VGKHPDETEAGTYDISRDLPVFMSVASDQNMTDGYSKYLVACNNFFNNQYA